MAATNNNQDIFTSKVVPIMDKVRDELNRKQQEEFRRYASIPSGLDAYNDRVVRNGGWSDKTVDDYINMVKAELKKQGITVDAVMDKKMIDYVIAKHIPRSSAEYFLRQVVHGSIFSLASRMNETPLQSHISERAEKKYNPSTMEEIVAGAVTFATDIFTSAGSGWVGGLPIAAVDGAAALTPNKSEDYRAQQRAVAEKEFQAAQKRKVTIPQWMCKNNGFKSIDMASDEQLAKAFANAMSNVQAFTQAVERAKGAGLRVIKMSGKEISITDATVRAKEYGEFATAIYAEQEARKNGKYNINTCDVAEASEGTYQTQSPGDGQTEGNKSDYSGWNMLDTLGLSNLSTSFGNLGYSLAMLPDMLIGAFTGDTKSLGMNSQTMLPLAALICGAFTDGKTNPFLKMLLLAYGGVGIFNTASNEAVANRDKEQKELEHPQSKGQTTRYKQYADEELNSRMKNPQIEGNVLLVDIDNVPRLVTLPQTIIDAYKEGSLPLNTIANRVLAKADQMSAQTQTQAQQQTTQVNRHFEQSEEREQVRGIR